MKELTDEEILKLWKAGMLSINTSLEQKLFEPQKKSYKPDPKPLKKGKKK